MKDRYRLHGPEALICSNRSNFRYPVGDTAALLVMFSWTATDNVSIRLSPEKAYSRSVDTHVGKVPVIRLCLRTLHGTISKAPVSHARVATAISNSPGRELVGALLLAAFKQAGNT